MTIQQFRIVLEVAKTGSISRAAANMFLSQPNASNSVRALEKELGYTIFLRTNTGIEITEQGQRFLAHARKLLSEVEQIEDLRNEEHVYRLHLGVLSYAPTVEAFLKLCVEYTKKQKADLLCLNMSDIEGIRAVGNMRLDMMAALVAEYDAARMQAMVEGHGLRMELIKKLPLNINLREGHPLLRDGNEVDLTKLADYPFVAYEQIPQLVQQASDIAERQITYKYRIAVDERDTRCRIVSTTDAFSIGCQLPKGVMDRYHIVSVRMADHASGLYCIMRNGEQTREEICRYIELLHDELRDL